MVFVFGWDRGGVGGDGDDGYDAFDVGAVARFDDLVCNCEGKATACRGADCEDGGGVATDFRSVLACLFARPSIHEKIIEERKRRKGTNPVKGLKTILQLRWQLRHCTQSVIHAHNHTRRALGNEPAPRIFRV